MGQMAYTGCGMLALAAGWFAAAQVALAQVNTETLRLGVPSPGFQGDFKGDLALKRGNVELLQVGGSGRVFYQTGVHTPLLFARAEFAEQGGERFAETTFVHARWTAMWLPRLGSEVFAQLQYDAFLRLTFRALSGFGPRFAVVLEKWLELFAGTAYMLEREVLDIAPTNSHPQRTLNHRWTTYGSIKLKLGEVLGLSNVAYVQPRIDRFADVRFLDELELQARLHEHLSLVDALVLRFDSDPPDGVRKWDLGLTAGLRINL